MDVSLTCVLTTFYGSRLVGWILFKLLFCGKWSGCFGGWLKGEDHIIDRREWLNVRGPEGCGDWLVGGFDCGIDSAGRYARCVCFEDQRETERDREKRESK